MLIMKNCVYILVSGSRSINEKWFLYSKLSEICINNGWFRDFEKVIFVGGGCNKGVDSILKNFCWEYDCGYVEFLADWNKYGKSAGMIRNKQMIDYVCNQENSRCVCFWDNVSSGCKNVIDNWKNKGSLVVVNK